MIVKDTHAVKVGVRGGEKNKLLVVDNYNGGNFER